MADDLVLVLMRHKSYAALFAGAALVSFGLTPGYIALARRMGWVDRPGGRKAHAAPTPTMGGMVVMATVIVGAVAALMLPNRVGDMVREHRPAILTALACSTVMMLVGIIDDRRGLRPRVKLLTQLVLAMAAFMLGFRIAAITLPALGSVNLPLGALFSPLLTIVWIVGVTNAVNLTDGLDGLAAGVGFVAAAANAAIAIYLQNYYMAVMMLLLAGALLGFLPWNFHPARVFLGDTGSLAMGMLLALCSLHAAQKAQTAVMILVPLCALGYPIFDTLLAVARRTLAGQPVFGSDREHIHHRMERRAYGASGAAVRIYVASLLLIGVGVLLSSMNHFYVGLGMAAALALAAFCVRVLGYFEWAGWSTLERDRDENRVLHAAADLARLKVAAARSLPELLDGLGALAGELNATAVELEHGGELHRWSRPAAAPIGDRPAVSVRLGVASGFIELIATQALDPRGSALWDELCRRAGARLERWSVGRPPGSAHA
ncbi:MAG: MraY family glycosyltransferase [Phycisphaerae bacterium]